MKKSILISIFVLVAGLSSCKKDFREKDETTTETMEDINVPTDFDWKTTKSLTLHFTASSDGLVELVSNTGVIYQKAFLRKGITYSMMLEIPAYEENLIARFGSQIKPIALGNEIISLRFNE